MTNEIILANDAAALQTTGGDIQTAMDRFIDYIAVQDVTVKSYAVALRCFMEWLRDNGISRPERDHIKEYQKYLSAPRPRHCPAKDNSTEICPSWGLREALEAVPLTDEQKAEIIAIAQKGSEQA